MADCASLVLEYLTNAHPVITTCIIIIIIITYTVCSNNRNIYDTTVKELNYSFHETCTTGFEQLIIIIIIII